jgi:hypothetical protein
MAETRSSMDASSAIESIDEDSTAHRNSVHQRLRANSTIMQVKKLLGKLSLLAIHLCFTGLFVVILPP